jgi:hypothetical protein
VTVLPADRDPTGATAGHSWFKQLKRLNNPFPISVQSGAQAAAMRANENRAPKGAVWIGEW